MIRRYSRLRARELVLDLDTGEEMDTGERAGLFGTLWAGLGA